MNKVVATVDLSVSEGGGYIGIFMGVQGDSLAVVMPRALGTSFSLFYITLVSYTTSRI
jgi:hypothetical protein